MAKTARLAYLPQLSGTYKYRGPASLSKLRAETLSSKPLDCQSQHGSRQKSERTDSLEPPQSLRKRMISPMVLNPYRHRRFESSGLRSTSAALRSDSCTDSKDPERIKAKDDVKPSTSVQRESPQRQAGQRPRSTASRQFRKWLKKHIENIGQHEPVPTTQQPPKCLNKRELIDKASMRGIFKYRGDHVILDCKQLQHQTILDGCQQSSILHTEDQVGLLSATSLLNLIGP